MPNPIFITGCGRSGTKSLAKSLDQLDNVKAFHEPEEMPMLMAENRLYFLERQSSQDGLYLSDPVQVIRDSREEQVREVINNGYIYTEASHFLSNFTREIAKVFPNAKIILLVRDGRDVVRSGMGRVWYKNIQGYPWTPCWWPSPAEDRFSKCCWRWSVTNKIMLEDFKDIPDGRKFIFRLEELIENGLASFLDELGIKTDKNVKLLKKNDTKRYRFPHWSEWNDELLERAECWMGDMLREFGYIEGKLDG